MRHVKGHLPEDHMRLSIFVTCTFVGALVGGAAHAESKQQKPPRASATRAAPANPCADPYAVCWAGTYVGRDPDPRVRLQILWDFQQGLRND
jgi:hypothetical protein